MKAFFPKLLTSSVFLALASSAALAASGWETDYEKALAAAKSGNKLLLMDFTGSDWCGWCMKLDKEVFSQKTFKDFAKANLVLLEVDFPQGKHQSRKIQEQNGKLQKEYGVRGFPTIIVLDAQGKKVGQLGYQPGGPAPFIAELEKLKSK